MDNLVLAGRPATKWALTSFDPWDVRITHDNVWDMYRAMREAGPIVRSAALGGFWCITTYQTVKKAATDYSTFSSAAKGVLIGKQRNVPSIPLELDRPEHKSYRMALQSPFLTRRLEELRDQVGSIVGERLDHIGELGEFDLVNDLAEPIPRRAISYILGIEEPLQEEFARLALARIHAPMHRFEDAQRAYYEFFRDEVVSARVGATNGSGFVDELLETEIDGRRLGVDETAHLVAGLATAGYATTIHAIASLLYRVGVYEAPREWYREPGVATRAVEEALRIDPPIHLEGRTAARAVQIGATQIAAGERVALLYASANHDDAEFPDPERYDPTRDGAAHLAFGHGVHKCLGAPLARLEMEIVLDAITRRFPNYYVVSGPVSSHIMHGHHLGWDSIRAATA